MPEPLLETSGLTRRFGGLVAMSDVALARRDPCRDRPERRRQTTLVATLAGELRPDAGTIRFAGHDISRLGATRRAALGIARSFQITSIFREFSVLDNVALAVQAHAGHSFHFVETGARRNAVGKRPAAPLALEEARFGRDERSSLWRISRTADSASLKRRDGAGDETAGGAVARRAGCVGMGIIDRNAW